MKMVAWRSVESGCWVVLPALEKNELTGGVTGVEEKTSVMRVKVGDYQTGVLLKERERERATDVASF